MTTMNPSKCSFFIGPQLRRLQDAYGLSQESLAKMADMKQPNVSNIISNKQKATWQQIEMFALGFGILPEQMLSPDGITAYLTALDGHTVGAYPSLPVPPADVNVLMDLVKSLAQRLERLESRLF